MAPRLFRGPSGYYRFTRVVPNQRPFLAEISSLTEEPETPILIRTREAVQIDITLAELGLVVDNGWCFDLPSDTKVSSANAAASRLN
jgi:hypothetical protein